MGTNFHTAWTTATRSRASELTPAPSALDKAITYGRNVMIHCDGDLNYDKSTGVLSWSAALRILFNREDGQAIANSVNAGSVTLADNEFAYITVSETNNTVLTVSKAAVTTGAASNFLALGRVVLAYRNTTSDECYAVRITHPIRKIEAHIADPTGGTTIDAEARTAINSILAVLEARKLTASS